MLSQNKRPRLNAGALAFVTKPLQSKDALDALLDYLKQFITHLRRRVVVLGLSAERVQSIGELLASAEVEVSAVANSRRSR